MKNILAFFAMIAQGILALGYPGILIALIIEGIGIPFPGDAFLILYGFASASGQMHFFLVWPIATIGYFIGTTLAFLAARKIGDRFLDKLHHFNFINANHVRTATSMMNRYSLILLAPGRLFPGIRAIASYAAGVGKVDLLRFLAYTCVGAAMWTLLWLTLGYWFGENMNFIIHTAKTSMVYISLGVAACILGYWFVKKKYRRV